VAEVHGLVEMMISKSIIPETQSQCKLISNGAKYFIIQRIHTFKDTAGSVTDTRSIVQVEKGRFYQQLSLSLDRGSRDPNAKESHGYTTQEAQHLYFNKSVEYPSSMLYCV